MLNNKYYLDTTAICANDKKKINSYIVFYDNNIILYKLRHLLLWCTNADEKNLILSIICFLNFKK